MSRRWWAHERFDVANTFTWRLAFSLVMVECYTEMVISAFLDHKGWSLVGAGLTCFCMLVMYAVMAREVHLRYQALWSEGEDDD